MIYIKRPKNNLNLQNDTNDLDKRYLSMMDNLKKSLSLQYYVCVYISIDNLCILKIHIINIVTVNKCGMLDTLQTLFLFFQNMYMSISFI